MRYFLLFALALSCIAQSGTPIANGRPVADLVIVDSKGRPVPIPKLTAARPALLLFTRPDHAANPCQIASALERLDLVERPGRGVVVLGRFPPKEGCAGVHEVSFYHSPEVAFGSSDKSRPLRAALIDESQRVRWTQTIEDNEDGWKSIAAGINMWFQGRQSFEVNCGHCHGLDGAQASSPDVKTLVGITKKYPEPKVLELGVQFGGVDMTGWSDAKKEILLTYIRGL